MNDPDYRRVLGKMQQIISQEIARPPATFDVDYISLSLSELLGTWIGLHPNSRDRTQAVADACARVEHFSEAIGGQMDLYRAAKRRPQ